MTKESKAGGKVKWNLISKTSSYAFEAYQKRHPGHETYDYDNLRDSIKRFLKRDDIEIAVIQLSDTEYQGRIFGCLPSGNLLNLTNEVFDSEENAFLAIVEKAFQTKHFVLHYQKQYGIAKKDFLDNVTAAAIARQKKNEFFKRKSNKKTK
jgi:hypothetical protein